MIKYNIIMNKYNYYKIKLKVNKIKIIKLNLL